VHHADLTSWTAEAQQANTAEDNKEFRQSRVGSGSFGAQKICHAIAVTILHEIFPTGRS
jgi:hypothetical protein